jgi:small subunit ribosomal protein S1
VTYTLTEEQSGGTTPEPEAMAAVADRTSEDTAAAVAVADQPAPSTQDPANPGQDAANSQADGASAGADAAPTNGLATEPTNGTGAETQTEAAGTQAPGAAEAPTPAAQTPAAQTTAAQTPAPTSDTLSADETADAPAASDDEDEPAPARELGPEPTTMAELLAEQDSDIKSFKHGDVVEGQVVRIDKDEILVDIGAKSEGVVSNRELFGRHGEGQPALNIGDTVLVYVLQPESPEGHVVLSLRRAGLERKWRAMQEQFEAGVIIEAPVIDHNKGGLIVDCGIRGFVPISQIVDFPRRPQNDQPRDAAQEIAEKLQPFVGRKLRLKILEVNRKANRLILSEKVALYEERREKRDELFSSLQVGQKVTGTVRSIAPFGVFIDLGGIDGLVHKSELSWNKVNNPEAGYRVGEEVEAEVIDINHERGRISLSIRRLQPDPWHSTVADFKVGDIIDGTVTKLVNFGAFVRVRDGLEGLIHISELSHQRVAHPGDVVHEGQTLKLKIISLDSERHRLGLSLKQAEEPPARPAPEPGIPAAPSGPRPERRPRPERSYSMSDAVQEPEGGIDNTLASAFAQVRQQLAAAEVDDVVEQVAQDETAEEAAATAQIESIADDLAADEVSEETAAASLIDAIGDVVAEDEANEEAAAVGEIDAVVDSVRADEVNAETTASDQVGAIVDSVAADEGSFELAAAGEIESLEDAAEASDDNEAAASEAIAEVVEAVAAAEQSEEAAAVAEIEEIVDEVNATEFTGETAAEATVESIVDDVNADEYSEETAAEAVVEEIVNTVAADEGSEEAEAEASVEEVAAKVAGHEDAAETLAAQAITEIADETMEANTQG